MANEVELGLAEALLEIGVEANDFTLSVSADGDISRASAVRALKTSLRDTYSELIARVVNPLALHDEVTLTRDATDTALYPDVPPRTVQVMYVYDAGGHDYEDLGALVKGAMGRSGFRWTPHGIRLFNVSPPATLYAWLAQEPPTPSYGQVFTPTATSINIVEIPTLGVSSLEKDYYIGAWLGIEAGTGKGQVRVVTDYDPATGKITVPAWTTIPDATSYYSFKMGVPRGAAYRAAILGAVMKLKRSYKAIQQDEDDLRAAYMGELQRAAVDLKKRSVGLLPRVRQIENLGFNG